MDVMWIWWQPLWVSAWFLWKIFAVSDRLQSAHEWIGFAWENSFYPSFWVSDWHLVSGLSL